MQIAAFIFDQINFLMQQKGVWGESSLSVGACPGGVSSQSRMRDIL